MSTSVRIQRSTIALEKAAEFVSTLPVPSNADVTMVTKSKMIFAKVSEKMDRFIFEQNYPGMSGFGFAISESENNYIER